jgi:Zn-dependent protease with chaperone function
MSDGLAEVRELLPRWAVWGVPLLLAVPVALCAGLGALLGMRWATRGFRRDAPTHWAEVARLTSPARWGGALAPWLAGALGAVFSTALGPNPGVVVFWFALSAGVTHAAVARGIARLGLPRVGLRDGLRSTASLCLLVMAPLTIILVAIVVLPDRWGWGLALGLVPTAAALWLVGGPLHVRLMQRIGLVKPAGPELTEAWALAGGSGATAFELDWTMVNAVALPKAGVVLFSRRAIEVLSVPHLAAVAAHEIAHLNEGAAARRVRTLAPLALLPLAASKAAFASFGLGYLILMAGYWLLLPRLFQRFSQRMELRADEAAAGVKPDEGAYAEALEAIHRTNLIPAVFNSAGESHPHLYDRLIAVGRQPDFPRPKPPAVIPMLAPILLAAVAAFIGGMISLIAPREAAMAYPENRALQAVAIMAGDEDPLYRRAGEAAAQGRVAEAFVCVRGCAVLARRDPYYPAHAALLAVQLGRCAEARRLVALAETRAARLKDPTAPAAARHARALLGDCR